MGIEEALKLIVSTNRYWAEWSIIVVVGGLAVEMIVLWAFSHGWRESVSLSIAVVVIAAGVYGEYHFGSRAEQAAATLQQLSELKAEQTLNRALRAELAILRLRLPRNMTPEQQEKIAALVRPFGKKLFDLMITPGAENEFLHQIKDMLIAAGWEVRNFGHRTSPPDLLIVPPGFDPGVGVAGTSGVRVLVDTTYREEFEPVAKALIDALRAEGFAASGVVMDVGTMRPEIIHIQIGLRL